MATVPASTLPRRRWIERGIFVFLELATIAVSLAGSARPGLAMLVAGAVIGAAACLVISAGRPKPTQRAPRRYHLRAASDIVATQRVVQVRFAQLNTQIERLEADLDAHRLAAIEIEALRLRDPLTGLPNRDYLIAILNAAIETYSGRAFAVMCLNIDRFHTANATLGREGADALLSAVAKRIVGAVASSDTVGRVGADEFIIVARDSSPLTLAQAVQDAIAEPFTIGEVPLVISATIGISRYPIDASDSISLVEYATSAMHDAKRHGALNISVFTPGGGIANPLTFAAQLRNASGAGELVVYYQPIVATDTGQVISAEALVRWDHPTRGHIGPLEFIPLAEETGLIHDITLFTLEHACQTVASLPLDDAEPFSIAVNVSAVHFKKPGFANEVRRVLREQRVLPHRIDLELTETLMADFSETTITNLNELRALGVRLSIDDFGTGYSSLSYVKRLPIQKLKIDRSFITDIVDDPIDRNIASTIISLARTLGLYVIAEGIETSEQLKLVQSLGADAYQGFLFSRPLNPQAFAVFLRAHGKTLAVAGRSV